MFSTTNTVDLTNLDQAETYGVRVTLVTHKYGEIVASTYVRFFHANKDGKSSAKFVIDRILDILNKDYSNLTPNQRITRLYKDFKEKEIMLTSSFAASSAMLLKLFSDVNSEQLIYFIDTRYHFKDTLIYKEYLTKLYGLNVKDIKTKK